MSQGKEREIAPEAELKAFVLVLYEMPTVVTPLNRSEPDF